MLPVRVARLLALVAVVTLATAACTTSAASPSVGPSVSAGSDSAPVGSSGAPGASATSGGGTSLVVGLGYIPSVQFAQFYLAQQEGYYTAAGLSVTFQNKIDPDLVTLVGQGNIDIGLADGTSVIPAGSQGIPVRYVATVYAQDPNIVVALPASGITKAAELKGRNWGSPANTAAPGSCCRRC